MNRRVAAGLSAVIGFACGVLWSAVNREATASPSTAVEPASLKRPEFEFLAQLPIPEQLTFCGTPVPLDRSAVREAIAYELVLSVGKPTMPLLWMRRAPNVLPAIERELNRRGLPNDLKYLPMIESDLRWTARSPANAVGLWQFVDGTARRYGLRIDSFMDERLDPDRSTEAGLSYLKDLHQQFGDWFLTFAAYNSGEGRVQQALQEQASHSYFDMYLPYETRRYVPRLIAAKLIYESPENYGLVRMQPLHVTQYRTENLVVRATQGELRTLAAALGWDYASLRLANPQFKSSKLPKGTYRVRIAEEPLSGGVVD
jgi:hypothetical protein